MARRGRGRTKGRPSVPTPLTPRREWPDAPEPEAAVEPDPVATQPTPAGPGTALALAAESTALTPELAEALAKQQPCLHCLGYHKRYCPRVRKLRYHPAPSGGELGPLAEVLYWQTFDDSFVIWPEDLV